MDMKVTSTGQEILVPLNLLRPSRRNVRRKSGGTPIRQLARSIDRVGLLHNLVITEGGDGRHYDVWAGKRRLKALQLLAKRKRLPKNHAVRCLLVPDEAALTASLTENTQREDMLGHVAKLSHMTPKRHQLLAGCLQVSLRARRREHAQRSRHAEVPAN